MEEDKKYNVLVVDDEKGILNLLENVLNQSGYTPFTAENGIKALEIIESGGIDVIITDVDMPKMKGDEMSKIIYEHALNGDENYKVPIIVISGYEPREGYDEELERTVATAKQMSVLVGIRDGFFPFLQKPFKIELVKQALKQALDYRSNPVDS